MSLFLFILNNMNNPKIDLIFNLIEEESVKCDLLLIEYSDKEAKISCFSLSQSNKSLKDIKLLPQKFCEIVNFLSNTKICVGTEDPSSLYNSFTHQQLVSALIDLPSGLIIFQYEDQIYREIVEEHLEECLRNTFTLE